MEKRKPHYALNDIKVVFRSPRALRLSHTARQCAESLGLANADIVALIQSMTRAQFFKSMTAYRNSASWQDVYHVPHGDIVLYVKITTDGNGYLVISLKEK